MGKMGKMRKMRKMRKMGDGRWEIKFVVRRG